MRLWNYCQFVASICTLTNLVLFGSGCEAGTWIRLKNQVSTEGVRGQLLLTDGTVLVEGVSHGASTGHMWKLTPDAFGSYVNGTWSQAASLPVINGVQYAPYAHAYAVLASGRVVFVGGEYNGSGGAVWTNMGAYYDPIIDQWTPLAPPSFFPTLIGDAASVVLPNGILMLASMSNKQAALLDPNTMTWTPANMNNKLNRNDEEGWTLLPNGNVLTVTCRVFKQGVPLPTTAEYYHYPNGGWTQTGTTGVSLSNQACETGAAVLMNNGNVFAIGASGNTGIYDYRTNQWTTGPSLPVINGQQVGQSDGPATLLPNGNVFIAGSPLNAKGGTAAPLYMFEYDGTQIIQQPDLPNKQNAVSASINLLVLPSGEILVTSGRSEVDVYTSYGTYQSAWQPHITNVATQLTPGSTYRIDGTLFNGMSQGAMFGDDYQSATNYPLVRITNTTTNHVFYCRTHDHSSMAVAAVGVPVYTYFVVPSNIETGNSILEVVANGIPSQPVNVTINPPAGS